MRTVAQLLIGLTVVAVLAGCVVVPAHRERVYVRAPVVVVHP
jgi:hypothetical protein